MAFSKLAKPLLVTFLLSAICSATAESASETLFHADPQHLWNRLNATLFTHTAPDNSNHWSKIKSFVPPLQR